MESHSYGPNDYFAAERTLLAWVRTGMTLMGFGFVVARFGLFLREIAASGAGVHRSTTFSVWMGSMLLLLGVGTNVYGAVLHWQRLKQFRDGNFNEFNRFAAAPILGIVLGLVGVVLTVYLLSF